ncbi:MAG: ATP-binding protein [Anaerolineae bacterium]
MNKSYSRPESYIERWLTEELRHAVRDHPVVVLTGARQVGKSTLLRNAAPFASWRFHTMDDFETQRQAREDAGGLWAGTDQIVLDEVQKAPELLPVIKQAVDEDRQRRRFVLSGSANLALMSQVTESLAGRAVYYVLHPLAMGEIHGAQPTSFLADILAGRWPEEGRVPGHIDPVPLMLRGLMPPVIGLPSQEACIRWWDGYVTTYLERDLRQLSMIENLVDYRRLMELLALRNCQLLNQSELARDAGLTQATAHRYIGLIETTHLFERLPAYTGNRTTSLVKSPKAYWIDPGLALFLAGIYDAETLRSTKDLGAAFETWIFHHLRVLASLTVPRARLYYWRLRTGQEVDFVLEHGRQVVALEVKFGTRVDYGDSAPLRQFLDDCSRACAGLIVYGGDTIQYVSEKIIAVPWWVITG